MSSSRHALIQVPPSLRTALAAGLAAVVLLLGLAHVSPDTHAWIHAELQRVHDDCSHPESADPAPIGHEDHACAVELFGHGTELPLEYFLTATKLIWRPAAVIPGPEPLLAAPRHLRKPERGPPAA